jgi:ATP-dependent RNA helicase RhlE
MENFYGLGIAPKLLEVLDKNQFKVPTPIQAKAIPIAIEGKDVMGIAQTGTGKTLAFGIPMMQRLAQVKGRGLVLLPTRELAQQVEESLLKLGRSLGLKTALLIGGASMGMQRKMLAQNPHIIIATPGRLIDHLDQRTLQVNQVKILVLDEADRMLDMGFAPQINRILETVPKERQTMLFSATMPKEIIKMATSYMKLPVQVEVAPAGTTAERVIQEIYFVHREKKIILLQKLLEQYRGSILVFSRTKHGARKITDQLRKMGHRSAEIHSNRSLGQRREALEGFKTGKYRVLVATDIAARGIDVKGIELVINFDLPDNPDDYVHRIGRTGRAGSEGRAISFATPDQSHDVKGIERLVRQKIPVGSHPDLPKISAEEAEYFSPKPKSSFRGGQFPRKKAWGRRF